MCTELHIPHIPLYSFTLMHQHPLQSKSTLVEKVTIQKGRGQWEVHYASPQSILIR